MIIVEGCDNTGKTTLINKLVEEFPELIPVKSCGPVSLGKQLTWFSRAIQNEDPRMIYDRFSPIAEQVYGPIFRQGSVFGTYWYELFQLMLRREPLIIHCRTSMAAINKWGDRDQMAGVKDHARDVVQRYDFVLGVLREMYLTSGRMHTYDYTADGSYDEISHAVRVFLEIHKMRLPVSRRRR